MPVVPRLFMLLLPRTLTARGGVDRRLSTPVAIVAGSLLLAALSLLLPTTPTYDPWAWIIWGREITQLDLSTVNGPSWKPLPVAVTTVGALFGDASPWIWMLVARAGALAGVALAFVLARRIAGPAAGLAAAIAVALAPWYLRNAGLGNSEGLMVALLLATVVAHLDDRRGWAFAFGVGCGLLRPEAWPFLGLYALWLLWEDRGRLVWLAASLAGMLAAWLGPELWGSGNAWRASDRAQQPNPDSPAFAEYPALQVLQNAVDMVAPVAVAGAVLMAVVAVVLRRRSERFGVALGLLALAAAWIGLVAVMTVGGFSGNQRYLVVPAALLTVVGAAGVVSVIALAVPRLRRVPAAAAAAAGLLLAVAFLAPDADSVPDTLRGIEYQATLTQDLDPLIADAGGADRLLACGRPYTGPFLVPVVAWELGTHINAVRLDPEPPAVVFHVKTVATVRWFSPGLRAGGSRTLARRGGWVLSADCKGPA